LPASLFIMPTDYLRGSAISKVPKPSRTEYPHNSGDAILFATSILFGRAARRELAKSEVLGFAALVVRRTSSRSEYQQPLNLETKP
jgi:hypothetical protein